MRDIEISIKHLDAARNIVEEIREALRKEFLRLDGPTPRIRQFPEPHRYDHQAAMAKMEATP